MGGASKRRARIHLREKQDGKCHWCGVQTIYDGRRSGKLPPNYETIDHLRERFDPTRQEPNGTNDTRLVLACYKCNSERSDTRAREVLGIEGLWARSGRYPKHLRGETNATTGSKK